MNYCEDCYFYTLLRDMGASTPLCNYHGYIDGNWDITLAYRLYQHSCMFPSCPNKVSKNQVKDLVINHLEERKK